MKNTDFHSRSAFLKKSYPFGSYFRPNSYRILFILFFIAHFGFGQSLSSATIHWTISTQTTLLRNDIQMNSGSITTFGDHIEIRDKANKLLTSYKLTNGYGDLADASQSGKMRYAISSANRGVGVFTIEKSGNSITMRIRLDSDSGIPIETVYTISDFKIN